MNDLKGAILILTYNRANLLDELLSYASNVKSQKNIDLIVVRQTGNKEVNEVIKKFRNSINVLIDTDGSCCTIPENIGRNRLAGYAKAFDAMDMDWVLAVEEDVLLAGDTIDFCEFVLTKYIKKRKFRGINLGSRIPFSEEIADTFSKTRFGIYGQAAVMTSRSWHKMQKYSVIKQAKIGHWDSAMEAYMKTGMTICPNNSRYIDRGWNGSHTPSDPNDPYYLDLNNSFVGNNKKLSKNYNLAEFGYWWREDLKKYKSRESIIYWVIFYSRSNFFQKLYKCLKPIKK